MTQLRKLIGPLAMSLGLTACGDNAADYGMVSDENYELVNRVYEIVKEKEKWDVTPGEYFSKEAEFSRIKIDDRLVELNILIIDKLGNGKIDYQRPFADLVSFSYVPRWRERSDIYIDDSATWRVNFEVEPQPCGNSVLRERDRSLKRTLRISDAGDNGESSQFKLLKYRRKILQQIVSELEKK